MTAAQGSSLSNRTLFITGASRGIGKAIALRAARDGANVVLAAKTTEPHPKLRGTIFSAAEEVEAAGGKALAVACDVRLEDQVDAAVAAAVNRFGGIDIVVNNASAISLTPTPDTPMKRFDLMHQVNVRATYMVSRACLQHLARSENAHILTLSPPLRFEANWFGPHVAYSMSKYGMSLCILGLAEELAGQGIAANALWPRTMIATAAVENLLGGEAALRRTRHPEIVADAAHYMLTRDSRAFTGRFCIDEEVLREAGVSDFSSYAVDPTVEPALDLFV